MSIFPDKKRIDSSYILSTLFRIYNKLYWLLIGDVSYAKRRFRKLFNRELSLNNPIGFNEKIQWLKLNDRRDLHTLCADKVLVRQYVKEKIGGKYLIPLVKTYNHENDFEPEQLIKEIPFIIKCNHNSSAYCIVRNFNDFEWHFEKVKFSNLLKQNYYYQSREWQYKNIKPKILVEKLLLNSSGGIPPDFKIFCFNGKAKYIQVDLDRQEKHSRNFYDTQWNLLPMKLIYENGSNLERPKQLEKMLELAGVLSNGFSFARIDFYAFDNMLYFGEITFHPESGFGQFNDIKFDNQLGNDLRL